MPTRLKSLFALWFVLQIVLPFTAPLQTCDLRDLFGSAGRHGSTTLPESSSTPTTNEADLANSFVSPLVVSALRASTDLAEVPAVATPGPVLAPFDLSPSPQVQQTVLRL